LYFLAAAAGHGSLRPTFGRVRTASLSLGFGCIRGFAHHIAGLFASTMGWAAVHVL